MKTNASDARAGNLGALLSLVTPDQPLHVNAGTSASQYNMGGHVYIV